MVELWRPETHMFHLSEGEMTITLKDVAILTGLPISGEAIIGSTTKPEGGWGPLIRDRLGFDMPTNTPIQGRGHADHPQHEKVGKINYEPFAYLKLKQTYLIRLRSK
ncbi:unnamed protein product [Linum tenue]|uniref:Aminotransferase-like plant mobile domain-containing protein n=1 Tax=Linum tenue TaxID=586396 RepID=A0AAV0RRI1_9ROSI|nr:unnamed protein product [Linum tenue]